MHKGKLPFSLLIAGTPDDVRKQIKRLIETVGRGERYIMDAATGLHDAKLGT